MAAAGLLNDALAQLAIANEQPNVIYDHINDIVAHLQGVHEQNPIGVGETGYITEMLCRYGLQAAIAGANGGTFDRMPRYWKWIGDFYLLGEPFNIIISVKSYKARERLLASGTGNFLSPTIGWGLFNAPNEFSLQRLLSYAYRGFVAIYAPAALIQALPANVLQFTNINGNPLMRNLANFVPDIQNCMNPNHRVNPRLL